MDASQLAKKDGAPKVNEAIVALGMPSTPPAMSTIPTTRVYTPTTSKDESSIVADATDQVQLMW